MKGKGGVWVSCGGKDVTKMDQGRGRGDQKTEARVERGRKEAKRGFSVPCWAPATYHHLAAAYQRVIHPHSLEALFQAKVALQGGALQTQGRGFYSSHPSDRSQNMAAATLTGGLGTPPALCPPKSSPWPSSQGLQTLRTLAYDTDSLPVTPSVLNQFPTP